MSFGMSEPANTISALTLRSIPLAAASGHHATRMSSEAIAIAAVGALVVLACLGWALARAAAFEPHWTLSARHAIAEAGFRASATLAEFSDWVRLGR